MAELHPTASVTETFVLVEMRSRGEPALRADLRLAELQRLVESAGGEVADSTIVSVREIHAGTYLSRERCEVIRQLIEQHDATGVVFDAPLSPAQSRNLESLLEAKVLDRTAVILDIFARRARTHEGRLQVEHAQLRYRLPRLTGRGREMSRLGGGIGTRGPGETKLETDRRRILARISQLQKAIEEIRKHRRTQRAQRIRTGLPTAAVVGYTNAGKSTLINRLTGATIFTADQLFATLDPTTRVLELPQGMRLAVIDTVGFIRDLPPALTAAFRATLEEMAYTDLLIQVVDAASPNRAEELETTDAILADLDLAERPRLVVWNKIDLLGGVPARDLMRAEEWPQVAVSAETGEGVEDMLAEIERILTRDYVLDTFLIPYNQLERLNELRQRGQVLGERYEAGGLRVTARVPKSLAASLTRYEVSVQDSESNDDGEP